jgi:isopenicillin N synthase-like dioxygenase
MHLCICQPCSKLICKGFFYITNFGLNQEQVDRQFAIGKEVFQLPREEKLKYRAELEKGGYNGYKPLGLRVSATCCTVSLTVH